MIRLGETLRAVAAELESAGLDEARVKAEWLLAGLLEIPRWKVQVESGRSLDPAQQARVGAAVARLLQREPLQYVLGEAEFHGRLFRCDRRALIPRPETEELTAVCLRDEALWSRARPVVADVGTGTGCIALTLALERPQASVIGIDLHSAALELARENAARLGNPGNILWRQGDLLAGVEAASLDAVVSNPPYVSAAEWIELAPELKDFEPRSALVAGDSGLELLQRLAVQAFGALRPGGMVFFEMGATQGEAVRQELDQAGFRAVRVLRDLAGHPRIATGQRP